MKRSETLTWVGTLCTIGLLTAACGGGAPAPAPAPAAATAPAATAGAPASGDLGTITGKISFMGTPPAPAPLKTTADPNCTKTGTPAVDETILVGAGGGLQNVFVYVKDGLGNTTFPAPATPVVLDQQGCHYTPHVLGIQVGQPLEVVNSDMTLHNVHAVPAANQEFNMGQPVTGMKMTHTFSAKEVMVPFKCDVHGWMHAWVGVLDHPFYAVSTADGSFSLKGLPAGTYTIEAWHEKLGTKTLSVTIGDKESKDVSFAFAL